MIDWSFRYEYMTECKVRVLYFQAEDGIRDYKVTGVQTCAFFIQAEDGIRDYKVTGVQTCALPISATSLIYGTRRTGRASSASTSSPARAWRGSRSRIGCSLRTTCGDRKSVV